MSALSEIRKSYPIAGKAESVLQEFIEGWEPSKETSPATPNTGLALDRPTTAADQQDSNWLEIDIPPLTAMQDLPDFGPGVLDGCGWSKASSILPKDLHMPSQPGSGPLELDLSLLGNGVSWPSERDLFDNFYGSAFALEYLNM